MRTLLEAGGRLQRSFDVLGWQFCFIGGVANFRWGTPRLTSDLDLTLLTGFGREAEFAARPQDWVDIEGVILRQHGQLKWPQIWGELGELAELKEEPELLTELGRLAERAESVVGPFEWRP